MFNDIRILIGELKKNPLATICGLLIASVIVLVWHIVAQDKKAEIREEHLQVKIQELNGKLLVSEREWAKKYDELRIEQIAEIRQALEKQTKIEAEQKRLLKKVTQ